MGSEMCIRDRERARATEITDYRSVVSWVEPTVPDKHGAGRKHGSIDFLLPATVLKFADMHQFRIDLGLILGRFSLIQVEFGSIWARSSLMWLHVSSILGSLEPS